MRRDLLAIAVREVMGTDEIQQSEGWVLLKASYFEALSWMRRPCLCVPDVSVLAGYPECVGGLAGGVKVVKV